MVKLSKYRLTSKRLKGSMILTYSNGKFKSLINEFEQDLNSDQFGNLVSNLSYLEQNVSKLSEIGLNVNHMGMEAYDKLKLFCQKYKAKHGIRYRVSPADGGKIKLVEVNEKLLDVYLTSDNFLFKGKHSVSNYVKYFNELQQEVSRQAKGINLKYPDRYDRDFERKLSGKELSDYWAHLRKIGLRPKKVRGTVLWE